MDVEDAVVSLRFSLKRPTAPSPARVAHSIGTNVLDWESREAVTA